MVDRDYVIVVIVQNRKREDGAESGINSSSERSGELRPRVILNRHSYNTGHDPITIIGVHVELVISRVDRAPGNGDDDVSDITDRVLLNV